MLRWLVALLFLILTSQGMAQFALSGSVGANCKYATFLSDGCLGAPAANPQSVTNNTDVHPAGTYQYPNFFTATCTTTTPGCARQSGQGPYVDGSSVPVRPNRNVAGVDYPVGIPAGTVLKDPTTACSACTQTGNTLTVAGTITGTFAVGQALYANSTSVGTSYGTIVASIGGCTTTGTGGAGTYCLDQSATRGATAMQAIGPYCSVIQNRPQLSCSNPSGSILDGYDFSLHGGVYTIIDSSGGPCAYKNSYIVWYSTFFATPGIRMGTCAGGFKIQNNVVDGRASANDSSPSQIFLMTGTTGNLIEEYNAYFMLNTRVWSFASTGNVESRYNYLEGAVLTGGFHFEWGFAGASANYYAHDNTILGTGNAGIPNSINAPFVPYINAVSNITPNSLTLVNNVAVFNKAGGVGGTTVGGYALMNVDPDNVITITIGTVTLGGNYLDPTGNNAGCRSITRGGTATVLVDNGDTDLLNGFAITGVNGTSSPCYGHM